MEECKEHEKSHHTALITLCICFVVQGINASDIKKLKDSGERESKIES